MKTTLLIAGLLATAQIAAQELFPEDAARNAKRLFTLCRACHSLEKDGPQMNAPTLFGVLGRKAGSSPGFEYSEPMKNSPVVWTEQTLDLFLKSPQALIPGNKMAYVGMAEDSQRKVLVQYLKENTSKP